METANVIIFVAYLVASAFFVAIGIPCSQGWVPPNRLAGFRTRATLQDPDVWYAANRVAGYWSIATGIVVAVVSIATFWAGLDVPTAPLVNVVPCLVGIGVILTHGFLVIRRIRREKATS
ncbi:MAG TPA: SdpI family protein [Gemmataceae bacterium]|nr:SdpI family protein [Gemmataceae bacterium]